MACLTGHGTVECGWVRCVMVRFGLDFMVQCGTVEWGKVE